MLLLGVVNFLMVASRVQMLESPRFLLMSGDEVKARKVRSRIFYFFLVKLMWCVPLIASRER